ncbi:MAG TPA: hypothetical protein VG498_14145 [Terriglobales bacterium]|nr:hypothetical protein [Terriglobales bacterium]
MFKLKIIAAILIFIPIFSAGWQIGACELANIELRDDLKDIASQLALRVGPAQPSSDEDFRNDVIRRAEHYDIHLEPAQIKVERIISGQTDYGPIVTLYLAVEYAVPVHVLGHSFELHFNPTSGTKPVSQNRAGLPGRAGRESV